MIINYNNKYIKRIFNVTTIISYIVVIIKFDQINVPFNGPFFNEVFYLVEINVDSFSNIIHLTIENVCIYIVSCFRFLTKYSITHIQI